MPATPSKAEWKARIEPHLPSLRAASDAITRTNAVQTWLREASMEAAEGLETMSPAQGKMQGYVRMMQALDEEFPDLIEAVHELTEGFGTIELHWRPLHPSYSRLYIDFDRDYSVDVFVRLADARREGARRALETVADALPKGRPFPNRPNTATGLLGFDGQCLGVRVKAHLSEDRSREVQTATMLPTGSSAVEDVPIEDAPEHLLRLLRRGNDTGG